MGSFTLAPFAKGHSSPREEGVRHVTRPLYPLS